MSVPASTEATRPKLGELLRIRPEERQQKLKTEQQEAFMKWFTEIVQGGEYGYPLHLGYSQFRKHVNFIFTWDSNNKSAFAPEFLALLNEEEITVSAAPGSDTFMDGSPMEIEFKALNAE